MIGGQHLYASEACTARGWNWEAPSPVAQPRGSSADPPPPARPSRALACKQGVLGLGGRVGGGVGVRTPLPGHPWAFVQVRGRRRGGEPRWARGCRIGLEGGGGVWTASYFGLVTGVFLPRTARRRGRAARLLDNLPCSAHCRSGACARSSLPRCAQMRRSRLWAHVQAARCVLRCRVATVQLHGGAVSSVVRRAAAAVSRSGLEGAAAG